MYMVVDLDADPRFLHICKLLNIMSDKTPTMHPHNITYKIKQTDVFLAPNQPIQVDYHLYDSFHTTPDSPTFSPPIEKCQNNKESKHYTPDDDETKSEADLNSPLAFSW